MRPGLTAREQAFVQGYLKSLNATQAAIEAGYSENCADVTSCRMMKKKRIKDAIQAGMDKRSERVQVDADTILRELLHLSTVDVTQAFDDMGQLKPLSEIPEDVRRSISALEVNELFAGQGEEKTAIGLAKKIKFYDKTKALELLGKHLKLFTDRVEHGGDPKNPVVMQMSAGQLDQLRRDWGFKK